MMLLTGSYCISFHCLIATLTVESHKGVQLISAKFSSDSKNL